MPHLLRPGYCYSRALRLLKRCCFLCPPLRICLLPDRQRLGQRDPHPLVGIGLAHLPGPIGWIDVVVKYERYAGMHDRQPLDGEVGKLESVRTRAIEFAGWWRTLRREDLAVLNGPVHHGGFLHRGHGIGPGTSDRNQHGEHGRSPAKLRSLAQWPR